MGFDGLGLLLVLDGGDGYEGGGLGGGVGGGFKAVEGLGREGGGGGGEVWGESEAGDGVLVDEDSVHGVLVVVVREVTEVSLAVFRREFNAKSPNNLTLVCNHDPADSGTDCPD